MDWGVGSTTVVKQEMTLQVGVLNKLEDVETEERYKDRRWCKPTPKNGLKTGDGVNQPVIVIWNDSRYERKS